MRRPLVIGFAAVGALVVAAGVLIGVQLVRSADPGPECTVPAASGQPLALDAVQLQHASTINAVGLRRGLPQRAMVIALATALQESSLRNRPNGDRDSVGLFQQRPSQGWGTPAELQDPVYASGAFYDALVKVPNWQALPLTKAAQAVQFSGHPDAYAKWEDEATTLAAGLSGAGPVTLSCRAGAQPSTAPEPVRTPPPGLSGASARLSGVLAAAQAELGGLTVVSVSDGGNTATVRVAVPGRSSADAARALAAWAVSHSTSMDVQSVTAAGSRWSGHAWSAATGPGTGDVSITVSG